LWRFAQISPATCPAFWSVAKTLPPTGFRAVRQLAYLLEEEILVLLDSIRLGKLPVFVGLGLIMKNKQVKSN
jgi:hypothetical protein